VASQRSSVHPVPAAANPDVGEVSVAGACLPPLHRGHELLSEVQRQRVGAQGDRRTIKHRLEVNEGRRVRVAEREVQRERNPRLSQMCVQPAAHAAVLGVLAHPLSPQRRGVERDPVRWLGFDRVDCVHELGDGGLVVADPMGGEVRVAGHTPNAVGSHQHSALQNHVLGVLGDGQPPQE
jgi:hypothetical protein